VIGTSVHAPKMRMASYTTLRATMLLSDTDPLSFVNKALLWDRVTNCCWTIVFRTNWQFSGHWISGHFRTVYKISGNSGPCSGLQ